MAGRAPGRGDGGGQTAYGSASLLTLLGQSGEIEIMAARVGRFYGEGLTWAMALPIPALLRWADLMPEITRREHVR